ncbi:MAG TPA: hypothetical protein PK079_24460 [Leptospiraceae bacterium]|nr:hypothetical protein [Leptospiraceae bacterium]HMX32919.1 hypothetical protein [Leptospiraceae bacterium]HMY31520.1 hypothetical protein [Leptospiraceae bacterium]HMZ66311.1 hypothetical protein [Leptospiraceae bacterium]HNA06674.1 hypothetical protein [Leptospiraceae bacterium]
MKSNSFILKIFLLLGFILLYLQINCKSKDCNSAQTIIDKVPFIEKAIDCQKEDNSLLLGLIAIGSRSSTASISTAATCPVSGSLSNPSPVNGSSITLTGAQCTNSAIQSTITNGGNITLNCSGTISISSELTVPSNGTVFITGVNGSGTNGKVILDGGGISRIIYGNSSSKIIVKNLQFQNGKSKETADSTGALNKNAGGALFNGYKGEMTVIDCDFLNNVGGTNASGNKEEGGGAIYTKSFGKLTIVNSYFSGNTGGLGGAINNLLSKLTIIDSNFTSNSSLVDNYSAGGYGGAIYTDGAGLGGVNGANNQASLNPPSGLGNITICRTVFSNNTGKGQGGGTFLYGYAPDVITLDRIVYDKNSVIKNGAGDALGGGLRSGNADTYISNSSFTDNVALSQGGGFWKGESSLLSISNSTFVNNYAVETGSTTAASLSNRNNTGGICGAINNAGSSSFDMTNLTIVNNHAGFMSGAICGSSNSASKSIIAYNTAYNNGNSWKKGQNCAGNQIVNKGSNFEFPNKNTTDSTSDNITCFNSTIQDPLYQSSSNLTYTNSVVSPIPLATVNDCSTQVGSSGRTIAIKNIALQSGSPATGSGASCP